MQLGFAMIEAERKGCTRNRGFSEASIDSSVLQSLPSPCHQVGGHRYELGDHATIGSVVQIQVTRRGSRHAPCRAVLCGERLPLELSAKGRPPFFDALGQRPLEVNLHNQ